VQAVPNPSAAARRPLAPSARRRCHQVLEAARSDDGASRRCDAFLITLIAANVAATLVASLPSIGDGLRHALDAFETFSVTIFTGEYALRVWSVVEGADPRFQHPVLGRLRWIASPVALVDLLAILPFFLAVLGTADLRFLRVLRILRILKLSHYFSALDVLLEVVRIERQVFGAALFLLVIGLLFAASGIHLFEHEVQPVAFGSIPAAMWWAVATLTTVGYGDVTPVTAGGKVFGACITVLGVGMVALPTGILASGFAAELRRRRRTYATELRRALSDGVLDETERLHLDALRADLGLQHEDVAEDDADAATAEHRRRASAPPACPHCGGALPDRRAP